MQLLQGQHRVALNHALRRDASEIGDERLERNADASDSKDPPPALLTYSFPISPTGNIVSYTRSIRNK